MGYVVYKVALVQVSFLPITLFLSIACGRWGGSRGPFKAAATRDPLTALLQPLTLPCGPPTPVQWVLGLFPRFNWSGHSIDHLPQSRAKVKERV